MEYEEIAKLISYDEKFPDNISKFTSKKLVEVYDQNDNADYRENKQVRFKTPMLRSDLCNYSDAYIVVKGNINLESDRTNADNVNAYDKKVAFKNNSPFISCITKINGELIGNAEDLDIVMPMYNLLEYSKSYRKTSGSLFNYYRDEPNSEEDDDDINFSIQNSASFDYKADTMPVVPNYDVDAANPNHEVELEVEISIPLKDLGNFWRSLDMPLINCEMTLILSWYKDCVLVNKATRDADDDAVEVNTPSKAELSITDSKLYVPVVTLKSGDENKLLNQLKTGFKRTIEWNKYRSQMSNQPVDNNLNYLIDPTFINVNRLFVLAYENEDDRRSYSKYYTPTVEYKDFNVLVDRKAFFELPVKRMTETYEKIMDLGNNDYYTTGNLLDYEYFKKHYKLIAIDLSKSQF